MTTTAGAGGWSPRSASPRPRASCPPVRAVQRWLGSWRGIGLVAVGMARQAYDLELIRFDGRGWRATFYVTGMEHSPTASTGTAFEATPWAAVTRAAWARRSAGPHRPSRACSMAGWYLIAAAVVVAGLVAVWYVWQTELDVIHRTRRRLRAPAPKPIIARTSDRAARTAAIAGIGNAVGTMILALAAFGLFFYQRADYIDKARAILSPRALEPEIGLTADNHCGRCHSFLR
jgi:hypothetical protein